MHPRILIVLLGHDLDSRLRAMMTSAARAEVVIELERWRGCPASGQQHPLRQPARATRERQRDTAGKQYAEGPRDADGTGRAAAVRGRSRREWRASSPLTYISRHQDFFLNPAR